MHCSDRILIGINGVGELYYNFEIDNFWISVDAIVIQYSRSTPGASNFLFGYRRQLGVRDGRVSFREGGDTTRF